MKNLSKKVDELLESLKEDKGAFVMCNDKEGHFFYAYNSKGEEIAAGIATILSDWFDDEDRRARKAALGILTAIHAVVEMGGDAGLAVVKAVSGGMVGNISSKLFNEDKDDDDDDDEKCEDCSVNRTCNLPKAIQYRKKNGIPAPKKGKKSKKSSCDEN